MVDINDGDRVDAERGQAAPHGERANTAPHAEQGRAARLSAAGVFKQAGSIERHERGWNDGQARSARSVPAVVYPGVSCHDG